MEGFLFWEAMPTLPETVSLYNFSVTVAHKRSVWQYPYTLPSELLASGFHAPSWQWRMYQWTSEGRWPWRRSMVCGNIECETVNPPGLCELGGFSLPARAFSEKSIVSNLVKIDEAGKDVVR
jgi:hypothetical protein